MEAYLIPYQAHNVIPAHRVLVLAPHPDDEVFGCGGAIASHVGLGVPVQVVVLTDGGQGGQAAEREAECRAAASYLGYGEPVFWRLPDRGLLYTDALVEQVLALMQQDGVDMVYAPSPWEVHSDHRQACAIAMEAVKRQGTPARLAFYEVGVPLRPNVLLDISPHWQAKHQAMRCFGSQLQRQDYARHIEALNVFRTYTLPPDVKAAEAYQLVEATDLGKLQQAWAGGVDVRLRLSGEAEGGAASPSAWPLVSVLVRSMNRQVLARALDSVALQAYPNLEVVVVAGCVGHDRLPDSWGGVGVRLIETDAPVPRSRAANQALHHARGELLLFLDDDDWLLPDHIGRLANALSKLPGHGAAYTGVALVDTNGQPTGQAFDLPFDRVRLSAGNLMPIHAVMFRAKLLRQGLAFDPTLDLYEDWDFWNRLARLTVMAHLPGVSAVYQVHESSGVHEQSDAREQQADEVMTRWLQADDTTVRQMRERVWRFSELEERLLNAEAYAEALQAQGERAETAAAMMGETMKQMLASNSWRVTRPLRTAKAWADFLRNQQRHLLGRVAQAIGVVKREGWMGLRYRLTGMSKRWPWRAMDYEVWLGSVHQTTPRKVTEWIWRPSFSVVMPVYNPPLELLKEAVRSIQAQSYTDWELCMADDASTDPNVWSTLEQLARTDVRIRVVRRSQNGHISRASNDALALASGDFVVLMDNDDLLPPDALEAVAEVLQGRPDAQILYSDEDKLDLSGRHFGPYLKPDWNRLLFMGHNLISHLGVFRTALVRDVGGFRVGLEGSQDYDMALRCLERIDDTQVIHIPRVLYHWRAIEGSTALATTEKPYAVVAAQRALQEHRQHCGLNGKIEVTAHWNYRCQRVGLGPAQRLAVLVVGGDDDTLPSWIRQKSFSVDEVRACAAETAAVLVAIKSLCADAVLLVSPDLTPKDPGALNDLVGLAMEPGFGAAAGMVCGPNGELLGGAWVLNELHGATVLMHGLPGGNPGYMGRATLDQEVSAVHLDCVVVRSTTLNWLMETGNLPWGWCVGLAWAWQWHAAGLKLAWCPGSRWSTTKPEGYRRHPDESEVQALKAQWGSEWAQRLARDPHYHLALDASAADFSFR